MKPFSGCFLGFQFKTAGYHLNYQSQDKKGKFEERSIGFEERSNDFAGCSNDFAGCSNKEKGSAVFFSHTGGVPPLQRLQV